MLRLDNSEWERWRKFEHAGARRRFVLCRAALRAILCEELRCDNERLTFGELRHGKPFALVDGTPAQISFNVSHGGKHGLIAVAPKGRLGVDVEERVPRRELDGLVSSVLGPGEQGELASANGDRKLRQFYHLWTIKEALLKALGTGISLDMTGFEVPPALRQGAACATFRFPHMPDVRWRLEDLGNEDFAAAIAHEMGPDSGPGPD